MIWRIYLRREYFLIHRAPPSGLPLPRLKINKNFDKFEELIVFMDDYKDI